MNGKRKLVWPGKDKNWKAKRLNLNLTSDIIRILETCHSYELKKNLKQNFSIKVQKVKTVFNVGCCKELTLFGKAVTIKVPELAQLCTLCPCRKHQSLN